jgi:hypothetical protein
MKRKRLFSLFEAVDNLSQMADSSQGEKEEGSSWKSEQARPFVKETFASVHAYFKRLTKDKEIDIGAPETQHRLKAIMRLADEAASHVQSSFDTATQHEVESLQSFYHDHIASKALESLEEEQAWQRNWEEVERDVTDIARTGMYELERIRRDKAYELFFIERDDGVPFFTKNLIRHSKLVYDLDGLLAATEHEDPLLEVPKLHEKALSIAAHEMREAVKEGVAQLYGYLRSSGAGDPFAQNLQRALMALTCAGEAHLDEHKAPPKPASTYFTDFHRFLREALASPEYRDRHEEREGPLSDAFRLAERLTFAFFNQSARSALFAPLLRSLLTPRPSRTPVWAYLIEQRAHIDTYLAQFPNGPLFKAIDLLYDTAHSGVGFDPIFQHNYPKALFTFQLGQRSVTCHHLPSPTRQITLSHATVVDEYTTFLSSLPTGGRFFLINLQDRVSVEEGARSRALEQLQHSAEYADKLTVITLPKHSPWYTQEGEYAAADSAAPFFASMVAELDEGEEGSWYIPKSLLPFVKERGKELAAQIHTAFFKKKKKLSLEERLIAIELWQTLLTLACVMKLVPDHISFTSKDGVDTGAAATAGWYALLRRLSGKSEWDATSEEHLLSLAFLPALTIRERAIEPNTLARMASMHTLLESSKGKEVDALLSDGDVLLGSLL